MGGVGESAKLLSLPLSEKVGMGLTPLPASLQGEGGEGPLGRGRLWSLVDTHLSSGGPGAPTQPARKAAPASAQSPVPLLPLPVSPAVWVT